VIILRIEGISMKLTPQNHKVEILATASELKYTAAIRRILTQEFEQPSEEFVVFFA
jgi:hypothetical protein